MDRVLMIDDPETVARAGELAQLMGASVSQAIARAVQDSLDRERAVKQRAADILAAAAEVRKHLKHPLPSSDHNWLYGDDGLPA
jgi:hypothetical protein